MSTRVGLWKYKKIASLQEMKLYRAYEYSSHCIIQNLIFDDLKIWTKQMAIISLSIIHCCSKESIMGVVS